ncbi:hypothetical protein [Sulfitobacter guttiformis]|uniref:Uncharacterized protein n=1 Tax=Sulfitobacter guttiformis TaxID=74349 RepID=A0A420DHB6_9RHOB|nr:hypothetical protein [Sulfitobacter guttiformis]KIN72649.1 hypothetical protein Z949_1827 [Sulfitobacter guttiformis KCTC 32187]RKE93621.1 hypothetical protein C8N30_2698 [Sulfitobacter guttiformis]
MKIEIEVKNNKEFRRIMSLLPEYEICVEECKELDVYPVRLVPWAFEIKSNTAQMTAYNSPISKEHLKTLFNPTTEAEIRAQGTILHVLHIEGFLRDGADRFRDFLDAQRKVKHLVSGVDLSDHLHTDVEVTNSEERDDMIDVLSDLYQHMDLANSTIDGIEALWAAGQRDAARLLYERDCGA